jgi:hypothetical protein
MNGFDILKRYYWECQNCGANGIEIDYKDALERCHLHREVNPDCDETKKPKGEASNG